MLLALAFVSEADVLTSFVELCRECLAELHSIYDEFKEFFVTGKPARDRCPVTRPRYPVSLWNQYETAINKSYSTDNLSESWHNRFQLVVGKNHLDIYTAIGEIQKEQGYTEIYINELAMGKKVKVLPTKKWNKLPRRFESIATEYNTRPGLEYLPSSQRKYFIKFSREICFGEN